jgi:hypothetical protein
MPAIAMREQRAFCRPLAHCSFHESATTSSAEMSGTVASALGRRPAQAAVPASPLARRRCRSGLGDPASCCRSINAGAQRQCPHSLEIARTIQVDGSPRSCRTAASGPNDRHRGIAYGRNLGSGGRRSSNPRAAVPSTPNRPAADQQPAYGPKADYHRCVNTHTEVWSACTGTSVRLVTECAQTNIGEPYGFIRAPYPCRKSDARAISWGSHPARR